jgi:hypothetical protein
MDKNGNILAKVLTTIGIVADWIVAGILKSQDGSTFFDLDNNLIGVRSGDYRVCLRGSNGALLIQHWNSSTGTWDEIGSFFGFTSSANKPLSQINADAFRIGPFSKTFGSIEKDEDGNVVINSYGQLKFISNAGTGGKAWFAKDSNDYGNFALKLATPTGDSFICYADSSYGVLLQTISEKGWIVVEDDAIEFGTNGEYRGSIDATGFHGWINGYEGIDADITDKNGNVWHFRGGILTGVN